MFNEIEKYRASDVFGLSRDLPLNYVEREGIDDQFKDSLNRSKHVVVFGGSKQGKTSLRKNCLSDEDYITIHCSNKWDIGQINSNILKQAGFEITVGNKVGTSGKTKVLASFNLFTFMKGEGSEEEEDHEEKTTIPLEIDIEDVNDVINALEKIDFKKFIILEDFHYLKPETQRDFAIALKAYHENSKLTFIVIGVWLEENRLIALNGDLTGRVLSVDADKWDAAHLSKVIELGEDLLNIKFDEELKNKVVRESNENVYILQEICYKICEKNSIKETCDFLQEIKDDIDVEAIAKEIVNQQTGRYNAFLNHFSEGFQETELQMYKWILFPVLSADEEKLEEGLRYNEMKRTIQEKHPRGRDLNPGNLTQSLTSTASLQIKKGIKPNILDYDQTNLRLNIVDRGFLIWLRYQNREELLDMIGIED